jgi:hypothetical protein
MCKLQHEVHLKCMNFSWLGLLNSPPQMYMLPLWMTAWCAQRGVGLKRGGGGGGAIPA